MFQRSIDLSSVQNIVVGQRTRNIGRATNDINRIKLCFSLVTQQRTVDFQACSILQRDALVEALRSAIKFNLIHKPVKKRNQDIEITIYTSD